jgi:hypothetical protein
MQSLSIFQLLEIVVGQLGLSQAAPPATTAPEPAVLAEAVSQAYRHNYQTVTALADAYGFEAYFFWQPYILIGDKPLADVEQKMITGLNWVLPMDDRLMALFENTYEKVDREARGADHLYMLSDVFDEVETKIWIDTWGHVTPEGNKLVAQRIMSLIKESVLDE